MKAKLKLASLNVVFYQGPKNILTGEKDNKTWEENTTCYNVFIYITYYIIQAALPAFPGGGGVL